MRLLIASVLLLAACKCPPPCPCPDMSAPRDLARPADLARLRTEALAELRTRSDDAEHLADDLALVTFWNTHPFRIPTEGREASLKRVTLTDLRSRWRTPASEWALIAVGPRSLEPQALHQR